MNVGPQFSFGSIRKADLTFLALRLHPPIHMNMKHCARDTVLPKGGGCDGNSPIFAKKGILIVNSPHVMHRRKDLGGRTLTSFDQRDGIALDTLGSSFPSTAGHGYAPGSNTP